MTLDPALFRQAMSRFASGVTVITTVVDGQPYGLTVSAFASLSLDPALAIISIDNRSPMRDVLLQAKAFAINILSSDQEALSRHFAGPQKHDWSEIIAGVGHGIAPLLDGALANLECGLYQAVDGGDHTIFIGQIEHVTLRDGSPLLYYRGAYHDLVQR
ncbi:flavin reductase family protein [Herpetosiphon giganteus]|uniref:flavin reductase family protein n=1 Tax=Herpetosiphon giganteus TaxID=2029754 RepID=UPI00195D0DFF|nr:flavin reductase family protein [Herpetosiphon giganteus]MBM7846621.1 flavin reductase (DIM6/NTAB) family NADH-FMN oxidoreductase RutF [Herpetosiphon giganteus]